MLERERAKEAQRPLSMRDAAPRFPTLLPSVDTLDGANEDDDAKVLAMLGKRAGDDPVPTKDSGGVLEQTLSCLAGEKGDVQLLFGGCIQLGSVNVGGRVLAVTAIPPSSSEPTASRLALHVVNPSGNLTVRIMSVTLQPTLEIVVRTSSASRAILEHAFEALQEARNLWDEARRIGKGWLQRIADVSRPHGGEPSSFLRVHRRPLRAARETDTLSPPPSLAQSRTPPSLNSISCS